MKALVLEKVRELNIRDIELEEELGPLDVRIKIHTVGICGSDIHYFAHGRIGPFVVEQPMVLGHEASGVVLEIGTGVEHLKPGDRVCMEPGIPDPNSRAARLGMYNLDPKVRFWATPPIHGCMRETVVHPAAFTFKLPEGISMEEGAMVEPLAIGMHAATRAKIAPGDLALVHGAGTIGLVTALAALAGGCSRVLVSDVKQGKLDLMSRLEGVRTVNVLREDLGALVEAETEGWGVDLIFECSGSEKVILGLFDHLRPGGRVVQVGMPVQPTALDIVKAQAKEATMVTIFRYAHMYPRALALLAGGKIDLKPFITDRFPFAEAKQAFEWSLDMPDRSVKAVIRME